MPNLNYFYTVKYCAHERRSAGIQNEFQTCTKTRFLFEPQRNLQNLCTNVHGMWRKT